MKFSDFVVWLSHTSYIEWAKTAVEALKAVAWPLTALFAIRLFKEDLRRLASKLRLFEGFGLKMDFGKEVLEVLAIANELSSNSSGRRPASPPPPPQPEPLFEVNPEQKAREMIFGAWALIEKALMARAREKMDLGLVPKRVGMEGIINLLVMKGGISAETAGLAQDARKLYDAATHHYEIKVDWTAANNYAALAERIVQQITEYRPAD